MENCFARMSDPKGPIASVPGHAPSEKITVSLKSFSLPGAVSMFAHGGSRGKCNNDSSVTLASRADTARDPGGGGGGGVLGQARAVAKPAPAPAPAQTSAPAAFALAQGAPPAPAPSPSERQGGNPAVVDADRAAAQFLASLSGATDPVQAPQAMPQPQARPTVLAPAFQAQVQYVNNQYVSDRNRPLGFPAHRDGDYKLV
jgi:hypothetical protein